MVRTREKKENEKNEKKENSQHVERFCPDRRDCGELGDDLE
jgi:hypothetical protein